LCQNRAEDPCEEDVKQVEEGSDSGDDRRVSVGASRRQTVEPRSDGDSRSAKAFALRPHLPYLTFIFPLAPGPHPRRELTLMPRLGFPCPRLGMAAGAPSS
jgi:hypothetical protein